MLSAVLSFLGGSAFRMIWGEVSAYLSRKQDHQHEIERMRLQGELDAAQHARNLDAIRLQADMGIKLIEAKSEAAVDELEAQGWLEAVKATAKPIGIAWVDAWNAMIRPGGATWGVAMLTFESFAWFGVTLAPGTQSVIYAFLGLFVADRTLGKKGK